MFKFFYQLLRLFLLTSTFTSLKIRPRGLSKISPRTLCRSKSNSMKPRTSLRRPKPTSLNWISRKHLEKNVSPCYKSSWHKQVRYLMFRSESYCIVIQDGYYFYKRDYHSDEVVLFYFNFDWNNFSNFLPSQFSFKSFQIHFAPSIAMVWILLLDVPAMPAFPVLLLLQQLRRSSSILLAKV